MGRFDSLKENPFTGGNQKQKKNGKKDRKNDIKKKKIENNEIIKNEEKKEDVIIEEEVKPKEESEWIKRIKKTEEITKPLTDTNNPKYWDGPIWKGPVYLKGNKIGEKCKKYIENASKMNSSIIIPHGKTLWSRDGVNWYNSYNESFSEEHLQAIENYEWQKEMNKFAARTMKIHEKRREESERNYWETGEIDSFMWAEIEHEKYEKYCEKLEKEWEEAERLAREEEEKEDEEEYLEEED